MSDNNRDFKKEYLSYQYSMDGDCMGYESWLEGQLRIVISKNTNVNIPPAPNGGVYGDEDVYKVYKELYESVHLFMAEVNKDSSYGALGLGGVASKARARAKAVIGKAKMLEDMVKAVCVGRK